MQDTPFIGQPHVRPVLITWSRTLALYVTLLAVGVFVVGGFVILADWIAHSIFLVLILLLGFTALAAALWLPTILPNAPPSVSVPGKK